VLAPIVETGWDAVLREAKRAKIPVILTDRTIKTSDESLYACFIGSDFYAEGKMAADWLAKHVGGKGNIVELQGTPGAAPANERRRAFADGIKRYSGLKIIDAQSGNFEQAIEEAGLKPGKDITLVSIDAIGEAIKAVAEGRLNCTVECSPLFGPQVYDTIAKILAGEKVPKKIYNQDELFDVKNAAKALPTRKY